MSSREDNDMYHESSPAVSVKSPPVKLTRSKTQTLDGEFVVSKVLEGPRKKDNKYLVSWEGYGPEGNTWEPRANLPEECFNCTSDDSGDDEPLHTQLIRKSVVPEPEIVKTAPPRQPLSQPLHLQLWNLLYHLSYSANVLLESKVCKPARPTLEVEKSVSKPTPVICLTPHC